MMSRKLVVPEPITDRIVGEYDEDGNAYVDPDAPPVPVPVPQILLLFVGDIPFNADSGTCFFYWRFGGTRKLTQDDALKRALKKLDNLPPWVSRPVKWWRLHIAKDYDVGDLFTSQCPWKSGGEIDGTCVRRDDRCDSGGAYPIAADIVFEPPAAAMGLPSWTMEDSQKLQALRESS